VREAQRRNAVLQEIIDVRAQLGMFADQTTDLARHEPAVRSLALDTPTAAKFTSRGAAASVPRRMAASRQAWLT